MDFCLFAAAFIAIFSIFAFFGPISPDLAYGNNMFLLMFGGAKSTLHDGVIYTTIGERIPGMTFLFVLQILIMLGSLIVFSAVVNRSDNKKMKAELSGFGLLSLVALILSFNTLNMSKLSNYSLGFGPILYSILHILVVLLYFLGAVLYFPERKSEEQASMISNRKPVPKWGKLSEEEIEREIEINRDLFKRGIINRNEFDKKVAELKARGYNSNSEDDKKKV